MKSIFTQKHYEALASFFKHELRVALALQEETLTTAASDCASTRTHTLKGTIRLLASRLQDDNPKFSPYRFYRACGFKE